jgi:malate synthase
LHRVEKHLLSDGEPISASLFDFGLYLYHNVLTLKQKGSGPYFSLPKLANRREAQWWNDVFKYSQNKLHLPQQTIKTTVCIETLPGVFEIDEIIYELRDHLTSLHAGRWNYLFSLIKNFRRYERYILADRDAIDMNVPFMEAYNRLLVKSAHRRNAHAIGGMTAILPDKRDESYEKVMKKVREVSLLEAQQGLDGTQVAHPDLIPVAKSEFEKIIGEKPHQKDTQKEGSMISRLDLLYTHLSESRKITEGAFRHNLDVLILYVSSWLNGKGVIELDRRLENTATAEICRTQMWQWSHQAGMLADGRAITKELWEKLLNEEKERITQHFGSRGIDSESLNKASEFISDLVWKEDFESYMTESAYNLLE